MSKKKSVTAKKSQKPVAAKRKPAAKPSAKKPSAAPQAAPESLNGAPAVAAPEPPSRLMPGGGELKALYERYTNGARFDEHDKAFYFVLDVGGINRARQLIAHVEEVLSEMEEFGS